MVWFLSSHSHTESAKLAVAEIIVNDNSGKCSIVLEIESSRSFTSDLVCTLVTVSQSEIVLHIMRPVT